MANPVLTSYEEKALAYAEEIGVYEYAVNGKYIEYWSFYPSEGWYFVRYDLDLCKEVFRGANIPFGDGTIPRFLLADGLRATKYNYEVG